MYLYLFPIQRLSTPELCCTSVRSTDFFSLLSMIQRTLFFYSLALPPRALFFVSGGRGRLISTYDAVRREPLNLLFHKQLMAFLIYIIITFTDAVYVYINNIIMLLFRQYRLLTMHTTYLFHHTTIWRK